MSNMHRINRNFMQMCWVVPDLDEAMATWTRTTGVGPFFYFEDVPFEDARYRGEPAAKIDLSAAIAQAGDMQIELVDQHDDMPSFIRDVVPYGQSGLHHLGLYCTDYDADLAAYLATGAELLYDCRMMGARSCWLDTRASLGMLVELVEANPVADAVFGQFRLAAEDWDGSDPVRTLS